MSPRVSGYLLASIGAALFASKAVVVKLAYIPVAGAAGPPPDAITLLALRMAFALPVYIAIGTWTVRQRLSRQLPLPTRRRIGLIGVAGGLGYYLASFLDFSGLMYITAQLERLILFTYPIVVVLIGVLFLKERVSVRMALGILLSYGGLLLVFLVGNTTESSNLMLGSAFVFGAAFSFALYQIAAKPLMEGIGSRLFTCIAMGGAACCVLLHFLVYQALDSAGLSQRISPRTLQLGIALALFCTVIPSFMMTSAIQRIGPRSVAIVGTLSPIATVVLALVILKEPFGFSDALGTVLVMAGVGLYAVSERAMAQPGRAASG